ncbi:Flp pilus assembly protein CpaB [Petroclostridium xylanilyticum]|jgi:pilus assembly protein CpaB|uniref:Flp pilus assembly protein CpaB n=1 Tax=Petroclostridium xylanilyticum TaxID=1792311 RepID=UPI000B99393D|nr:Flp pilus assembly protein CpaB [Petroclostridium xylanilyticum]
MQAGNKKILLLAVVLALVTSFLIYSYLQGIKKSENNVEYTNVVVAVKTIEKRAEISSNDVKIEKVLKSYANAQACTDINEVMGKRASDRIIQGEQILKDRLIGEEKLLLSYAVPEGKRAVTINVNEATEVGDFIRPGDYVDILATFDKYEIEDNRQKIVYPRTSKVILQNILVLGMGQLQDVPEGPRTELPKTVTLAVTLQEAERLALGEEMGVLKMALRRVGDHDIVSTQGVIREDLVTDRGKVVLPK